MAGKFIVTGGAGFIGSNIVAALNARGEDDVLVVDILGKDEKWKNLVGPALRGLLGGDDFRFKLQHDALGKVDTRVSHGRVQRDNGNRRIVSGGQQLPLHPRTLRVVPANEGAFHLCVERRHLRRRVAGLLR
jgi:hypothetical protein